MIWIKEELVGSEDYEDDKDWTLNLKRLKLQCSGKYPQESMFHSSCGKNCLEFSFKEFERKRMNANDHTEKEILYETVGKKNDFALWSSLS